MAGVLGKTFQCVVIAPSGKLLDYEVVSVVFPSHDGQVGIWHNHMPMLCKLGLGIMEVKVVPSDIEVLPHSIFLLIDGGIGLIGCNLLTVIAYDAVYFHNVEREKIERIVERAKAKLSTSEYTPQQRTHETQKFSFLTKLAQMPANTGN